MAVNTICPHHGDYADQIGEHDLLECPDCRHEAREAERHFEAQWWDYEHWCRCGIPRRFASRTLDNWTPTSADQEKASRLVGRYAARIDARIKDGDGLTLLGPPGTGKTHLLAALVTTAHKSGIRGLYWSWPDLIGRYRSGMKCKPEDPEHQVMDRAASCWLLALDEIGHGTGTEWERIQLFELVDYRYREGLSTLVASNATTKAFPELIGERLADRPREVNAPIVLPGESRRDRVSHDGTPAMAPPPDTTTVTYHAYGEMQARDVTRPKRLRYWF